MFVIRYRERTSEQKDVSDKSPLGFAAVLPFKMMSGLPVSYAKGAWMGKSIIMIVIVIPRRRGRRLYRLPIQWHASSIDQCGGSAGSIISPSPMTVSTQAPYHYSDKIWEVETWVKVVGGPTKVWNMCSKITSTTAFDEYCQSLPIGIDE